jgi:hypothetical protein
MNQLRLEPTKGEVNMSTNEDPIPAVEEKSPLVSPGNGSSVTVYMEDTMGAIFLGFLAGVLLIGWMRAEARYRTLITELEMTHGNHSPDDR